MSKSLSDPPQFTQARPLPAKATSSRSSPSRTPATSSGAGIETPAQKVARLRAAHLAKRASEVSKWDIIVVRGREVANTAHRWTVGGIVVFSICMVSVTTYTIFDMIRYNRKKKREFYETQSEIMKSRFRDALAAEGAGTATEDQLQLLNDERTMAAEIEEKKRQKPGVVKTMTNFVRRAFDVNLNRQDINYLERRRDLLDRIEDREKEVAAEKTAQTISPTLQALQNSQSQNQPGPLDKVAEEAVEKVQNTKKSWFGW